MHPYVYKKQHKPLRSVLQVFIFIMILCPVTSINSHSCNYAVKSTKIFSVFSKGYLRIEGNKVVASKCADNCGDDLYTVTIDKHYILLYHVKSTKFICWNKTFTKLVARLNPTNLSYCKFEDKPSKTFEKAYIRYTTTHNGRELEIRCNRAGSINNQKHLRRCLKKHRLVSERFPMSFFTKLDPKKIEKHSDEMKAYQNLTTKCINPNFMPSSTSKECTSRLSEFCAEMKNRKVLGHNITSELTDLCKHEWNKSV